MRKGEIKMTIRERIEQQEEQTLSKYATLAKNTKGRATYQKPCDIRTEFQRDRDRILHCKAFKNRLRYKTQVFLSPDSDHYLTRLVHTLRSGADCPYNRQGAANQRRFDRSHRPGA